MNSRIAKNVRNLGYIICAFAKEKLCPFDLHIDVVVNGPHAECLVEKLGNCGFVGTAVCNKILDLNVFAKVTVHIIHQQGKKRRRSVLGNKRLLTGNRGCAKK